MSQAYKRYLVQVGKMLCCPSVDRKRLMRGWRENLEELHPDAPEWTWETLEERLGPPHITAQDLQMLLPQNASAVAISKKRRQIWLGILAGILALVVSVSYIIWANGHDVIYRDDEITVITQSGGSR